MILSAKFFRSIIMIFFLIISLFIHAQTQQSIYFKDAVRLVEQGQNGIEIIGNRYSITKMNIHNFLSAIAKVNSNFSEDKLTEKGIILRSRVGNIITLFIPVNQISECSSIRGIEYLDIARKFDINLNKAVKDTRVDSVQQGLDLPAAFSGKDVIIGITDWGFDYTNPMFYDTLMQHTRILKAWDQFRNSGPAPTGFNYGTEIDGETALLTAQCDTFNIYQWATHGSHVAGIAGGSGAGTIYRGVAYEANYLLATFLVDEAAVLDAFVWLKTNAENLHKRLVVNMSWGLYWFGTLDGSSLLSQAIDTMSSHGVVFVSSGGNNGDVNYHIKKTFISSDDTLKTIVDFDNYSYYANMWGQAITMWGEPEKPFEFSIKILDPSYNLLDETPLISTEFNLGYVENYVVINQDTVYYNYMLEAANPLNQRPHIHLRIRNRNTSNYKIGLHLTSPTGTVHLWNVIELTNGVGNWGSPFISPNSNYIAGDSQYSIGEPSCTKSVISVAAHGSETIFNGTIAGGNIASFSSKGPTIDGRVKPDISAPGVNVTSSISSFTSQSYTPQDIITTVPFNGRNYVFLKFSGTSMSGPMVTGIVALILQANPTLNAAQIKEILRQTAREDIRTGTLPDTGSTQWGWGKVTANRAIKLALETEQITYFQKNGPSMIYPNPAQNYIHFINDEYFQPQKIEIYDSFGQMVYNDNIHSNGLDISFLKKGFYVLYIKGQNKQVSIQKLVKQ